MSKTVKIFLSIILSFGIFGSISFKTEAKDTYIINIQGKNNQSEARKMLSMVNGKRKEAGIGNLSWSLELEEAAMQRAAEINAYFAHTRPNGESCFTISDRAYGENISFGYINAESAFQGWWESPGHKANMMNKDFKSVGIASFKLGNATYWVQLFGYENSNDNMAAVKPNDQTVTPAIEILPELMGKVTINVADPYWITDNQTEDFDLYFVNKGTEFTTCEFATNTINWKSSNVDVAYINSKGVTYGGKDGTATITAELKKYPKLTDKIEVKTSRNTGILEMNLNVPEKKIEIGNSYTFYLVPNSNAKVSWRIGNSKIATVDSNGKVTGKSVGNTWLYAKTSFGKETKSLIKVTEKNPKEIKLNSVSKDIEIGTSVVIKATVDPSDASQKVTWRTGNSNVASVDANGKVTAKSVGNTWLYAKTKNGLEAKCMIRVHPKATGIKLDETAKDITVGGSATIKVHITPTNAIQKATWRTGNSNVATVDANGKVTAKSVGNTWLYAKTKNGLEAKCMIRVHPKATGIKLDETAKDITVGDSAIIKVRITPTNAIQKATWRTGNSNVATVDANGKVTAKSVGNTWLYAKTDNGLEAKCMIRVI